jgi:membrane-bound lytic murein transglycosylase B
MLAKKEEEKRLATAEVSLFNSIERDKKQMEATSKPSTLPDLTATSLRGMQGEDLNQKERQKRQQEQQKEWVAQQLLEKQERVRKERDADRQYQQKVKEVEQRYSELESNYNSRKLEVIQQDKEENRRLVSATI